jgi:dTDP-4-dehydrorhamnose 3,5-epimerase
MPFIFKPLEIPDVVLVQFRAFVDERGRFLEIFKASEFKRAGIKPRFLQDSCSYSRKNVIRGLHFQKPPFAQAKLVKVVKGKIWDVAVDIRKTSPTCGKWVARELSEENNLMMFIPEGFAHGFAVLSEEAIVVYKMSKEYAPDYDGGIIWNDATLKIPWPITAPIVSAKDAKLPSFKEAKLFN